MDLPVFIMLDTVPLYKLLVVTHLALAGAEAKRLIFDGAVKLDGKVITDPLLEISPRDGVLQVGRRKFIKLKGGF